MVSGNPSGKRDTSPERAQVKELVLRLWSEGFSAMQIAKRVNAILVSVRPLTRNAVIGITTRHRIATGELRHYARKPPVPRQKPRAAPGLPGLVPCTIGVPKTRGPAVMAKIYERREFIAGEVDVSGRKHRVSFEEFDERNGCRFIDDDRLVCNAVRYVSDTGVTSSYCEHHEKGMRQPAQTRARGRLW